MTDLKAGDEIEVRYEDSPETVIRATVERIRTDREEGMGPEVEEYIDCWVEIVTGEGVRQYLTYGNTLRYFLNGRHVVVSKV